MTAAAGTGRNFPDGFRRRSYFVGEREHTVWVGWSRREIRARMMAAQYYDRVNKEPGKRNGPLGHVALEILDAMYRVGDARTGRLDPSLDWLMAATRRSRAAIVAALKRLYEHGFVHWIRRKVKVDKAEGPQVEQFSNAYGLRVPDRVKAIMKALLRGQNAPPPDDDTARRAADRHDTRRMEDGLPLDEFGSLHADGELGEVLARLGRAVENSASSPGGLNPGMKADK